MLRACPVPADLAERELPALLSRVLLALACEERSMVSLAIAASTLRVLGDPAPAVADLPGLTGLAREAVAVSLGWLERRSLVTVGSGRARTAELTEAGRRARAAHARRLTTVEDEAARRWPGPAADLQGTLGQIMGSGRLAEGLIPPPGGWRSRRPYRTQTDARLADPVGTLPHFPAVTHRGGWPDGS